MYIDNTNQISINLKGKVRGIVRNATLDILSIANNPSKLTRPRIQFLYFHHIFKNEEVKLIELLKQLAKYHSFISFSTAVEKLSSGNIDKPYICFSSDDGFKNNLVSADIFKEFGVSCCYFICPSLIGLTNETEIKKIAATKFHLPPIEFLNWNDVETLQKKGHEIGSHTMSHARISTLTTSQIDDELVNSKQIIQDKTGNQNIHFAYPYGLKTDITDYAIKKINELGYKSCSSAMRGVHFTKLNIAENLIKRDQVVFNWNPKHIEYFLLKNCK